MKKALLSLFFFLIIIPSNVFAATIQYDDAKLEFEIDDNIWKSSELSKERQFIDKKWTSDCGMIATGTYDVYSDLTNDELNGLTRKEFNYKNVLKTEEDLENLVAEYKSAYGINKWEYRNYDVKYIYMSGTNTQYGITMNQEIYMTVNNGYVFMLQYATAPPMQSSNCGNSIDAIAKTARSTVKVEELKESKMGEEKMGDSYSISSILLGVAITAVCYMAYPIVSVCILKRTYDNAQARKMALWNSIIIGLCFFIATTSLYGNGAWNAGPAFLYYWINSAIWVTKKKTEEEKEFKCPNCGEPTLSDNKKCPNCGKSINKEEQEKNKETFECDNCGALVKESDTKCPNCGESFEEELEEEPKKVKEAKTDLDQKFSDLNKLKKLLDDKIITKAEFDKEKKKILND